MMSEKGNVRKRVTHSLRLGALHRHGGIMRARKNPVMLADSRLHKCYHTNSDHVISLGIYRHSLNSTCEMNAWLSFAAVVTIADGRGCLSRHQRTGGRH